MRPSLTWPFGLANWCGVLYLLFCAGMFLFVRHSLGGHFIYALDDPYIHLAMAENLAHGHYGINPVEYSSPSSSVIWPFLLLPFAGTAFHAYVPLLLNIAFGLISAMLIGDAVSRWRPQADAEGHTVWWQQVTTAVLLMLAANLIGVTFIGMEHGLQVMLAIVCALGLAEVVSGRELPGWCVAAAVFAPLVRYEDLTLTLAVCCALVGVGRWRAGVGMLAAATAPLVAFSLYLRHLGLPLLPLSVLVKGKAYTADSTLVRLRHTAADTVLKACTDPERLPILGLCLLFAGLAWGATTRRRRFAFLGAALAGGLQLLVGRFGWFYRYEVYLVIFLLLLYVRVLAEGQRFAFGYFAFGLLFCGAPYLAGTLLISRTAKDVYLQQEQMHRFVTSFYHGDYAVNDLGLVSFQRSHGARVLDVYGLASAEASRQVEKTAPWLADIVARHDVKLAILYPQWFHIPATWTPVARMCNPYEPVVVAYRCVVFYSTTAASELEIRHDLQAFARTIPVESKLTFDPPRLDESLMSGK